MRSSIRICVRILPVLCLSLFAVTVGKSVLAQDAKSRKLALLVGVKDYNHADLKDLQFAENDVEELATLLKAQSFEVALLTTASGKRDPQLSPTAANIERELKRLLRGVTKRDLILVGLAGHGLQPLGSDLAYFCPVEANPTTKPGKDKEPSSVKFPETLLSIDRLLDELQECGIGQKLILVDACRNDPGVRGRRGIERVRVQSLPPETGILLSCSAGQFAFEHESWGKKGHGAFFSQVIDGLSGAAAEESGEINWEVLALYVRRKVPSIVKDVYGKSGGEQRPNAITNFSEEPSAFAVVTRTTLTPRLPAKPTTPTAPSSDDAPELLLAPFDQPKANAARAAWAKHLGKPAEISNSIGMTLVLIPAGEFDMGSPASDGGHSDEEGPVHRVAITRPFYLGKYEVTKGQFAAFVSANSYRTEAEKDHEGGLGYVASKKVWEQHPRFTWRDWGVNQSDDSPVVNVSWNDAVAYCEWLSHKEGKTYRLPREAEWEYACRAGTATSYSFGDDEDRLSDYANAADARFREFFVYDWGVRQNDGYGFTAPVGKFKPNALGLHDMHGNVWEWCADWYNKEYYARSPTADPDGPSAGSSRVIRGGCWSLVPVDCRSASRFGYEPTFRSNGFGFRVLCER